MSELRGWKFPIELDEDTGRIKTISDNDNVRQSVEIIIKTQKNERKMRPTFGTDMNSFMFENVNYSLINDIAKEINRSVKKWEEHIEHLNISVNQSLNDAYVIDVNLNFVTDIIPSRENVKSSFNLGETKR